VTDLKAHCNVLRTQMTDALALIADDVNGTFSVENMTYDPHAGTVSIKVGFALNGENGETVDPALARYRSAWREWPISDGVWSLPPETLDQQFVDRKGVTHTVAGYNSRARKRPIMTTGDDGKTYRWPIDAVARALNLEPLKREDMLVDAKSLKHV